MIKIIRAEYRQDKTIRVHFSDGMTGDYDLSTLIARDTVMVRPLNESEFFQNFFLELGALCWKNGFELSAGGIYEKLNSMGQLRKLDVAA